MLMLLPILGLFLSRGSLSGEGGYAKFLAVDPSIIKFWLATYSRDWVNFWGNNGVSVAMKYGLVLTITWLAISQFIKQIRHRISVWEIFLLGYCVSLVSFDWPVNQGVRYLVPVIPLILVLALKMADRKKLHWLILVASLASYLFVYRTSFTMRPIGVGRKESLEMFELVKKNVNDDEVILFDKPRALSLFTGKVSRNWSPNEDYSGVDYVIIRKGDVFEFHRPSDL